MIRQRQFPLIGNAAGVFSFIHTDDLAAATLAAIEHGRPGETTTSSTTSPRPRRVAALPRPQLGAKPPRQVPAWLAQLIASPAAVAMMTGSRGASNAKAKAELRWTPLFPAGLRSSRRAPRNLRPEPKRGSLRPT